jgi:hypothetical protein
LAPAPGKPLRRRRDPVRLDIMANLRQRPHLFSRQEEKA